jgi:RNA polymerase sigma-70 factor (ECF subfamily)
MGDFDEVLEAARSGQERAVTVLYDALQPPLLGYLRWQEPALAEDLASETWLAVAERLGAFKGDERAFRAWVFGIARRRLADHRRRSARRRTTPASPEALADVVDGQDPATLAVERLSSEQAVARMTAVLPTEQAEVLLLRVVAGLSVEETARVVSKRAGAVRVLQHRAIRRLAREFGQEASVEV